MGLLARILMPSGLTHGRPPYSFSLSPVGMIPMVPNLITVKLARGSPPPLPQLVKLALDISQTSVAIDPIHLWPT
jgi:hypothetical protein